jgi:hypothetical protein
LKAAIETHAWPIGEMNKKVAPANTVTDDTKERSLLESVFGAECDDDFGKINPPYPDLDSFESLLAQVNEVRSKCDQ